MDAVIDWLIEAGLDISHKGNHYDHWKGAIMVDMPISMAEKLCMSNPYFTSKKEILTGYSS